MSVPRIKKVLHIEELLSYTGIEITQLHFQLEKLLLIEASDLFIVRVAKYPEEIGKLSEVGHS